MTERPHLLPPNASALERAASLAIGPWTVGDDALATLQDPARIPAALLPSSPWAKTYPCGPRPRPSAAPSSPPARACMP